MQKEMEDEIGRRREIASQGTAGFEGFCSNPFVRDPLRYIPPIHEKRPIVPFP